MPLPSSSSDEHAPLPAVPRRRRAAARGAARVDKDYAPPPATKKEFERKGRRGKRAPGRLEEGGAGGAPESEETPPLRRTKRVSRRTLKTRKIVDDDDDDDDDDNDNDEVVVGRGYERDAKLKELDSLTSENPGTPQMNRKRSSRSEHLGSEKSNSSSPPPVKKKRKTPTGKRIESVRDSMFAVGRDDSRSGIPSARGKAGPNGTARSDDDGLDLDDETGNDDQSTGKDAFNDVLEQLEREVNDERSDQGSSEDSEEQKETRKKPARLTRRQRALKGEKVELEYGQLGSPKGKKPSTPDEDWSHDEEVELKRQQKARLRQMVNEKRNKEKRAAMVDKVLRGVTSKRKKLTMASEARAAEVGTRLNQNEMREGFMRFISNKDGISLSIPEKGDESVYLRSSVKAVYPRACTRDPRTGKRIFVDA